MVLPIKPFRPWIPIPNDPFVSGPPAGVLATPEGPLFVGTGLKVDFVTNFLNATGGGEGSGTVTKISTGVGLTGGPITETGTISLRPNGVAPGTYQHATISVDEYGRVREADSGAIASFTSPGILRLATNAQTIQGIISNTAVTPAALQTKVSDSINTACPNLLASSTAVKSVADIALAAIPKTAYANKGTVLGGGSTSGTYCALPLGADGQFLTACAASPSGLAWSSGESTSGIPLSCISTKGAIVVGAAPSIPVALTPGPNGHVLTACSSCTLGIEWLPVSEVLAIPCSCITGKGALITGNGTNSPVSLPVGQEGQYLTVCSACPSGITWAPSASGIPIGCLSSIGTLVVGSGPSQAYSLSLGSNGDILVTDTSCPGGMRWTANNAVTKDLYSQKGSIVLGNSAGAPVALPVGLDGQTLVACASNPNGVVWSQVAGSGVPCTCLTNKGYIIVGSGPSSPVGFAPGTDGLSLIACAACPTGLTWAAVSGGGGIPCACITGKGALITGSSANNPSPLPIGEDGYVLVAHQSCPLGLDWYPAQWGISCDCIIGKGSILTGLGPSQPSALPVSSTDGSFLRACSECELGLTWSPLPPATPVISATLYGQTISTTCNTSLGQFSLQGSYDYIGRHNTAVGYRAAECLTNGCYNSALGAFAGVNSNGHRNTFSGWNSGSCVTGHQNTYLGYESSGGIATNGCFNVAVGDSSSTFSTGSCQVAIGVGALYRGGHDGDIAIGYGAMGIFKNIPTVVGEEGQTVIAIGPLAAHYLRNTGFRTVVIGGCVQQNAADLQDDTAVGHGIGFCATQSKSNAALGSWALRNFVIMSCNVAIGHNALRGPDDSRTTTCCNVAVGYGALASGSNLENMVALGYNSGNDSLVTFGDGVKNTIVIGNAAHTCFITKPSLSFSADERDKNVIGPVPLGLSYVNTLEPVVWQHCDRNTNLVVDQTCHYGFTATNLALGEVNPNDPIIADTSNQDTHFMTNTDLLATMVNAIKELSAQVTSLQAQVDALSNP